MEHKKYSRSFRHLISIPFILGTILPLVILDIFFEIYHHICFLLYGIKLVKRSNYIRIDRHKLKYLNWFEKIGCAYCGYGNGLLHYMVVIGKETEKYWCGIKHKKYPGFVEPKYHKRFLKYGDKIQYDKISKRKNKK
ncbi:MAG: hypothetical protein KAT77_04340 [Nanoarchaeota archaeon]|nr:hypothetical protein [Nanoarchaeota archaeon]